MTATRVPLRVTLAAILAGSLLAAPVAFAQPGEADTVESVEALGRTPTSVTIQIVGKSPSAVRGEIRSAVKTVCRNALKNYDIFLVEYPGCREATQEAAISDYRAILRAHPTITSSSALAGGFAINIATR